MKMTLANTGGKLQKFALVAALAALPLVVGVTGCCSSSRYHHDNGQYVDDQEVTSQVKHALRHDPEYKFQDIQVTTYKGVVQLSGFANTRDQKSRAADAAKAVPGVKEVENNITVKE